MSESILRTDILPNELTVENKSVRVTTQFTHIVQNASVHAERSRTPGAAKNLSEFYSLTMDVIEDYERRQNVINDAKVYFTEEDIDYPKDKNVIVAYSLVRRQPGSFSKGAPFDPGVTNQKPILREEIDDPDNPGYKRAVLGYWHDNEVKFTICARTNKVANEKVLWFENIMQEYSWYFTSQGVSRVLFLKRESDYVIEVNGVKIYCRPLHYFVRTETLRNISEKVIEDLTINVSFGSIED